jgi:WD40 repeat protein
VVRVVGVTLDNRAVSASADETLKVWKLESGRALRTRHGHTRSVWAVAVTPDSWRAVSAFYDQTLKVRRRPISFGTFTRQVSPSLDGVELCERIKRECTRWIWQQRHLINSSHNSSHLANIRRLKPPSLISPSSYGKLLCLCCPRRS